MALLSNKVAMWSLYNVNNETIWDWMEGLEKKSDSKLESADCTHSSQQTAPTVFLYQARRQL